MKIFPAIDLINGKAVRLEKGDYGKMTKYSDNPVDVAKQYASDGAEYIHIVDLDGAKAKKPVNLSVVKDISKAVDLPVQVGGGVRSAETAGRLLEYADRVIIGTVAITRPQILKELVKKFGAKKIIVSVDYKDGAPAVNGWLEKISLDTQTLQNRLSDAGVKTVIVTDTNKDGLLRGPNLELMKEWKKADFEIICAGGISSTEDIKDLKAIGASGAIIGKALYEGKITLKEVLNAGQ